MSSTGFTPVGFVISWHVPSTVPLADLRAGVTAAGFDAMDLVPDLNSASIVARSAGKIARMMTGKTTRRLARKVEYAKRQITAEHVDPSGLTYQREAAIEFDDNTGKLTSDTFTGLGSVQTEIEETRRATDVTRVVQRVVESAGSDLIQIRDQGGAYFVPAGHEVITKVRTVLDAVGGTLSQFACTIGHGDAADQTGQSVANVITDYLLKQIEELNEAVALLNEKGIRSDVRRNRLSTCATIKDRIGAYASLLGTQHGALESAMAKAEDALLAKLGPSKDDESTGEPEPAMVPSFPDGHLIPNT